MKQNKIPKNEYIIQPKGKTNPYRHDVIYSNLGQWKYPGQVTRIPSNQITMQGVPYPVQGVDDTGYSQMMYPGMDYQFPGQYVTEYPMARYGGGLPKAQKGEQVEDNDSWLENIAEIVDPTGISSWDDIYRAYQNKGIGKELALESVGAIPLLGKVSKVTKPGIHLTKYTGLDAILKNTLPKNKSLSRAANVTSKTGRGTDAVQAALGAKDDSGFTWDMRHGEVPKYDGRNIFPQADLGETGDYAYGGDPSLTNIEGHYPFGGQNTKTHTHMAQGGWLDEYDEGGSKIKNKLSKNTLAKEQRSNQDNTRVSNLPIKTLQALQQQADVEKAARQQYKQQPVISQGKKLTPEEQAYSDKVQARIANPSNDLGIIGANMASALTRFRYLNPEEIAATTNNPMGTVGLSSDIMTEALANEMAGPAFGKALTSGTKLIKKVPKELPGSPNKKSISTNLEDLAYAKKWAKQYGYELPKNLERIAKSDELTNKTIRGLMNRHNSFTRGISTNWDELGKKNPKVLEYLNDVGIDYVNNPKAAAEYMATHIPGETGYGRYGLKEGENALYLSNSNPTAEGYTYGQGYTVKVKKPTDFSSANRKDWVTNNEFFANKGFKGSEYGTGIVKNDYIRRIPIGLRQTLAATGNPNKMSDLQKIVQGKEELYNDLAHQSWKKYNNLIDDLEYKTSAETRNKFLRWGDEGVEEGLKDAPNLFDKLQLKYLKNKKNLMQNYYHVLPLKDIAKGVYGDSDVWKALGKNMFGKLDPFSHYAIKGQPGEKVLEAINFKEIKPELWNNKSRAHINLSSKGLTRRKNGGWLDDMDDEYRRGGQKRKKYTSKNIQSSVNDLFRRNETLFGPAGKKRYKPGLKYKDGGDWLDKYQDTGEVVPKDDLNEDQQFLINMVNSPLFAERYAKMTGQNMPIPYAPNNEESPYNLNYPADQYKKDIINNINTVRYASKGEGDFDPKNYEGEIIPSAYYVPGLDSKPGKEFKDSFNDLTKNSSKFNKFLFKDEFAHLSDKLKELEKMTHKIYISDKEDRPYTRTHETSHASTKGELNTAYPYNAENRNPYKNFGKKYEDYHDSQYDDPIMQKYLSQPTEIKARVDAARKYMMDKGLYDPINKKFTDKDYNKLLRITDEDNIKDLKHNFSKEDIIRMFNEIVTNKPKTQPVAKMGGNWLDNLT